VSKVEHKHPIRAIAEQSPEAIGAVGELDSRPETHEHISDPAPAGREENP